MFKLMLVTDRNRSQRPLEDTVRMAIEGGVDAVQLRERDLPGNELHRLAENLRRVTRDGGAKLIINQRLDIAIAVEADGVHLGWRSLGVKDVRLMGGGKMLAGISCHDEMQVKSAEESGADYVLLGPVFPTPSKQGLVEALGIEKFSAITAAAKIPVIGIGGIKPENARQVISAGARGLAAISALCAADDPAAAARAFLYEEEP